MQNKRDSIPNFLLIGAMKSATSSICADLERHPQIFFPEAKEPNCLARYLMGDTKALQEYFKFYQGKTEKVLADGSTGNSKFPHRPQTAELASKVLSPDTKIVYMIRDPIVRIEKHISHNMAIGELDNHSGVVYRDYQYICASAYEMQLSYWKRFFPESSILTVTLEEYIKSRDSVVKKICRHLSLDANPLFSLPSVVANSSEERLVPRGDFLKSMLSTKLYRGFRERIPREIRKNLSSLLMKKAPSKEVQLNESERKFCQAALNVLNSLDAPSKEEIFGQMEKLKGKKPL